MDGLEGACTLLADRLRAALPGKTAELRTRYGADPAALPDVVTVEPHDVDQLGVEQWPAVLVVGQETRGIRPVDVGPTSEVYQVRYALRVFVWARGDGYAQTDTLRKRLTLGVRELLLTRRLLAPAGRVEPSSLAESYSDLARDEAGRTIGGAFIAVEVTLEETLTSETPPVGMVDTVSVDTGSLPPHPAL
ncbi:hypothetical protein LI90_4374 (plasmid) [Carbonactinospora thermoautotrophica]|uniref:Uncharacterized protein n=1 Tax=Carbonactinospora thermoautotrophica TaxID=1469144 RepID=A0A132MHS2_9ACTN|nr:hypothetical protein [Carbonactinospora thermoautotrophica]KWW97402.1 hypothetical protein LI90_4374 [Carbonactinospora thermoautotrophica]